MSNSLSFSCEYNGGSPPIFGPIEGVVQTSLPSETSQLKESQDAKVDQETFSKAAFFVRRLNY